MKGKLLALSLLLVLGICFLKGELTAMSLFSSDFQQKYQTLFQDVEKLNEYTKANKVELKGVEVKEVDLDGAEFHGATFNKIKWKDINLENSVFIGVVFQDCEFENSNLNGSKFIDCIFKNCKLNNTKINRATWKNGQFLNCQIENSILNKWFGDGVVFNGGKILDTPFAEGKIQYTFKNIELDGVQVVLTEGGVPLTVEDSDLSEVDFGDSHFSDIILRRVKQSGGGVKFNDLTAKSISFEDVDMTKGTAIGRSNVGVVRISGGRFGTAFDGSTVGRIIARDAELSYMSFSEATLPYVEIAKCSLYDTGMWDGHIKEFLVTNSQFNVIVGENFKADIVLWDNVTLDGKIDLTNAQVKDFRPSRINRGSNLQLITTGSNMRFN